MYLHLKFNNRIFFKPFGVYSNIIYPVGSYRKNTLTNCNFYFQQLLPAYCNYSGYNIIN